MAGSSANLGALNSEWSELAGKVAGAFYFPGSESQVAARRAQNGQDGSVAEQPTSPPVVVGQTPKLGTQALLDKTATTIANTPIDPTPAVPANKYDDVVAAAVAKGARNSFSDTGINGSVNIGATPIAAPVAAPAATVKPPVMNAAIMEQQQNLMDQIAAAQQVVSAGSNRDGYKMGDVTKGLATMQALSPLVTSSNNLIANTYGTDAGILTHSMDNTARVGIADAGNATEMAKAGLAANTAIQGHQITAAGNMALAERKAALEAASPAGGKALMEAQIAKFRLDNAMKGNVGANMALEGKQAARVDSVDPITGRKLSVSTLDPRDVIQVQTEAPVEKKKGK